jgi:phosphate uptake regulator
VSTRIIAEDEYAELLERAESAEKVEAEGEIKALDRELVITIRAAFDALRDDDPEMALEILTKALEGIKIVEGDRVIGDMTMDC